MENNGWSRALNLARAGIMYKQAGSVRAVKAQLQKAFPHKKRRGMSQKERKRSYSMETTSPRG